jgi:hypothetical protein
MSKLREVARHTMTSTADWQQDVADSFRRFLDKRVGTLGGILVSFGAQAVIVDDELEARGSIAVAFP